MQGLLNFTLRLLSRPYYSDQFEEEAFLNLQLDRNDKNRDQSWDCKTVLYFWRTAIFYMVLDLVSECLFEPLGMSDTMYFLNISQFASDGWRTNKKFRNYGLPANRSWSRPYYWKTIQSSIKNFGPWHRPFYWKIHDKPGIKSKNNILQK